MKPAIAERGINFPAIPGGQRITRIGNYEIRSRWLGNALSYDIYRNKCLHTCGIDRLSLSEEMALQAIRERINPGGQGN